jgi:hypothetical protein
MVPPEGANFPWGWPAENFLLNTSLSYKKSR